MAMVNVLAAVLSMALGVTAGALSTNDESCEFTNIDLRGAVERMLERLPQFELIGSQTFKPVFAGIEVGGGNVSGFREFHQHGPLLPYCSGVNGTRMLELHLIAVEGTEISVPWRHCSGREGSITFRASLVRLNMQLRVNVPESGQGVSLSYAGVTVPTGLERVRFFLTGAGEISPQLAEGLNLIFSSLIEKVWSGVFHREFGLALYKAMESN